MYNKKESDKRYRESHKEEIKIYLKKWLSEKKKDPVWNEKNKKRCRIYSREYHNRKGRESALRMKLRIIDIYGGKCMCCGILEPEFLAVDHINGNGNKHRRDNNIRGGTHFYRWLIKNNFPKGFQILCHNCNFAKDHFKDGCPHKRKVMC